MMGIKPSDAEETSCIEDWWVLEIFGLILAAAMLIAIIIIILPMYDG